MVVFILRLQYHYKGGESMTIDTDELIRYIEKPCKDCKDKNSNWCERCCEVTKTLDTVESFISIKEIGE